MQRGGCRWAPPHNTQTPCRGLGSLPRRCLGGDRSRVTRTFSRIQTTSGSNTRLPRQCLPRLTRKRGLPVRSGQRERHTEIPHTANQGSPPSPAPTDASVRAHTHNANTGTRKRARAQTQSHRASRSVTAPRRNISVDVSRTATTQDTGLRTVNMEDHEGCIIRDQATNFPHPATLNTRPFS